MIDPAPHRLFAADALVDALAAAALSRAKAPRPSLDLSGLLRGHARDDDGAALELMAGLGVTGADAAEALANHRRTVRSAA